MSNIADYSNRVENSEIFGRCKLHDVILQNSVIDTKHNPVEISQQHLSIVNCLNGTKRRDNVKHILKCTNIKGWIMIYLALKTPIYLCLGCSWYRRQIFICGTEFEFQYIYNHKYFIIIFGQR